MKLPRTKTLTSENIRVLIWAFLASGLGTYELNEFLGTLMASPEMLSALLTLVVTAANGIWWFIDRNIKNK